MAVLHWMAANWHPITVTIIAIASLILGIVNALHIRDTNRRAADREKAEDRRWVADRLIAQYEVLSTTRHADLAESYGTMDSRITSTAKNREWHVINRIRALMNHINRGGEVFPPEFGRDFKQAVNDWAEDDLVGSDEINEFCDEWEQVFVLAPGNRRVLPRDASE